MTVLRIIHVCCCATCPKQCRNFAVQGRAVYAEPDTPVLPTGIVIMSSCRSVAVLCLSVLLPALVICAGDPLPAAPEIAPAALPTAFIDAPEIAERSSDTYTLDAYVWRDSQPLIVSGEQQTLPFKAFPLL